MKKEREYKVIVKNPPTEKQKEEMIKRVEDYLALVYSNVKQKFFKNISLELNRVVQRKDKPMRKELKYKIRRTIFLYIPSTLVFAGMFVMGFFAAY